MAVIAYKLGALGQDSVSGIKNLAGTVSGSNYMTLETPVGTDYQVPAGKTFYITKLDLTRLSGNGAQVKIGYGDSGVAHGTVSPTKYVALTSTYHIGGSATQTLAFEIIIPIPAQKYPCIYSIDYE